VAVIGVADARWGEAVHAVIVLRAGHAQRDASALPNVLPNVLTDALAAWCRRQLAGYKCPRSFEFVAVLPLSAAGKVLKTELRARAQRAAA